MNDKTKSSLISGISRRNLLKTGVGAAAGLTALGAAGRASAASADVTLKFAYEGPRGTAQELAANLFQKTLEKNSNGAMTIAQYPGAQLGAEPTLLRKVMSGDIDMIISSTANASQIAPQSGVFSLHYLFSNFDQVISALKDEKLRQLYIDLAKDAVKGAEPLSLFTLPLRNFFAPKAEIHTVADMKGRKIRVQATHTEDMFFSAYGAIPIHMPFTEVYTSLQTGVIGMAENAITYYGSFKLYEVAPVVSMSQHEGNFQVLWISSKALGKLSDEQRGWVKDAAVTVSNQQPAEAADLVAKIRKKYEKMGILFNDDVDKESFIKIAEPLKAKIAKGLGSHAVKILDYVGTLNG